MSSYISESRESARHNKNVQEEGRNAAFCAHLGVRIVGHMPDSRDDLEVAWADAQECMWSGYTQTVNEQFLALERGTRCFGSLSCLGSDGCLFETFSKSVAIRQPKERDCGGNEKE